MKVVFKINSLRDLIPLVVVIGFWFCWFFSPDRPIFNYLVGCTALLLSVEAIIDLFSKTSEKAKMIEWQNHQLQYWYVFTLAVIPISTLYSFGPVATIFGQTPLAPTSLMGILTAGTIFFISRKAINRASSISILSQRVIPIFLIASIVLGIIWGATHPKTLISQSWWPTYGLTAPSLSWSGVWSVKAAINQVQGHWFGSGSGTAEMAINRFAPLDYYSSDLYKVGLPIAPNSLASRIYIELGLIGLLLWGWFSIILIYQFVRLFRAVRSKNNLKKIGSPTDSHSALLTSAQLISIGVNIALLTLSWTVDLWWPWIALWAIVLPTVFTFHSVIPAGNAKTGALVRFTKSKPYRSLKFASIIFTIITTQTFFSIDLLGRVALAKLRLDYQSVDPSALKDQLERAITLNPWNASLTRNLAALALNSVTAKVATGSPVESLQEDLTTALAAIHLSPLQGANDPLNFAAAYQIYSVLGDSVSGARELAYNSAKEAVVLAPNHPTYLTNLASAALAQYDADLLLNLNEKSSETAVGGNIAQSALLLEAKSALTLALTISPEYLPATLLLATLEERAGNLETAVSLLTAIISSAPKDTGLLLRLGLLQLKLGRWIEADQLFSAIIELDPLNIEVYWLLAKAQIAQGKFSLAQLTVAQLLILSPNHPEALKIQAEINALE